MASIDTTFQEPKTKTQLSPAARRRRYSFLTGSVLVNLLLLLLLILTVVPFLYMVFSAFKPNTEIFGTPITLLPRNPTLDNMKALLTQFPFARWMLNTAIVAIGGTITSLLLSSLAGFAFAKYDFRLKNLLFTLMLVTLLIPPQVLQIPQFEVIRELHWFNTYQSLIIPRAVGAFGIFLMRQYTTTVPNEILDSARVDGASEFAIWWRVVLPLVRPGLAVLGILSFTGLWNDFYWPLVVTTDPSMFVANLGIAALVGPYDYQYGILLSGAVLASLPIILMFLIFQRQFIAGLTQGAVK